MVWEILGDKSGLDTWRIENRAIKVGSDMEERNPDGGDVCTGVETSIRADTFGESNFVTGGLWARWKVEIPWCVN